MAQNHAVLVKTMLQKHHISPRAIDDKFSANLFGLFIDRLDNQRLYFTSADIEALRSYQHRLDAELGQSVDPFLNEVSVLLKKRLVQVDSMIEASTKKPFDFSTEDAIVPDPDKLTFAPGLKEQAARWQLTLKYYALRKLVDIALADSTKTTAEAKAAAMKQEPAIREKLRLAEKARVHSVLEHPSGFDKYISTTFCDALAACFDPHSSYMPPSEMESFRGDVTGVELSFGLVLDESESGEVIISYLVPGGPAWRTGELNQNDVLVKMKQEGKSEVDLAGLEAYEIEAMLDAISRERIELTVRKPEGIEKTVPLVKEKILDDEDFVKSFVLDGEKKIGYVSLPGFYTQWENQAGSSCANDVAKEIVKLKQENIQALVLDLRSNPGGSLQEAIDMAGIFIDEGPLMMYRDKGVKVKTMKDHNRGTIYDGPLLVLVNGMSASASEALAGTLQDYNRAVIVGGNTFGKGTAQVVLPVDTSFIDTETASSQWKEDAASGYVKVTVGKLYRVSGKTHQMQGVAPHVPLPDIYSALDYSEAMYEHGIPADTVKRNQYYKPLNALPVGELVSKSASRVNADAGFSAVAGYREMVKRFMESREKPVSLKWEKYEAMVKANREELARMTAMLEEKQHNIFTAGNNSFDKQHNEADEYKTEINLRSLESISGDIYIAESYRILIDLINSKP